jgi:hypothetical protein
VRDIAEDRPAALDWKTSKEVAFEYGFQLSAYLEGANEEGLDLAGRVVLWAPREQPGVFTAHPFPADEHAADYAAFLHALDLWRRVEELERRQRAAWARRKRAEEKARAG